MDVGGMRGRPGTPGLAKPRHMAFLPSGCGTPVGFISQPTVKLSGVVLSDLPCRFRTGILSPAQDGRKCCPSNLRRSGIPDLGSDSVFWVLLLSWVDLLGALPCVSTE
jgi:hypothetical protein